MATQDGSSLGGRAASSPHACLCFHRFRMEGGGLVQGDASLLESSCCLKTEEDRPWQGGEQGRGNSCAEASRWDGASESALGQGGKEETGKEAGYLFRARSFSGHPLNSG